MDRLHDRVGRRLASRRVRYSRQRRELAEVLAAAGRPLTTAELVARTGLPQSSVYRNLATFEQVGVVDRIAFAADHARFELAEDVTARHHHHLVCTVCGAVEDTVMNTRQERSLRRIIAALATAGAFEVDGHRLDVLGTCRVCA